MTNSKEKELLKYSTDKYKGISYRLLHDPYTTLLILITQEFLRNKDLAAAEATFHLFALKYYTNRLYIHTTPKRSKSHICQPDVFQSAFDRLSRNHMFSKQRTVPNSIMYYSRAVFKRHLDDLITDNAEGLHKMIYSLRTRIAQSVRSFFNKYYEIDEEKKQTKSKEDVDYDQAHETKLRNFINKITNDMCVYGKIDSGAIDVASRLVKFNKKLSQEYIKDLSRPEFSEQVETVLYLLLKDVNDISVIQSTKFLDHIQKLMSIKVTKQQVYFKKTITDIHNKIISRLKLEKWYNNLSIQSKSISRNFIAYYISFFIRNYV